MTGPYFDIVLQKFNLCRSDFTMNMPEYGEFLVEKLCHYGLNSGLIFGIDDFLLNSSSVTQSLSEVLIVCGVDQHCHKEFLYSWQKLRNTYQCRVLIFSEPIYSPLAHYRDKNTSAVMLHEIFLQTFLPHIVAYPSLIDVQTVQEKYGDTFHVLHYSGADPAHFHGPQIPWEQKEQAMVFMGKFSAWAHNQGQAEAWTRKEQLNYFLNQSRIPFECHGGDHTYRSCYDFVSQFRFQLQPKSGYYFHTTRPIQSALVGTIPVILIHEDDLPYLLKEAPQVKPDHNVLIGFDGQYEQLLNKMEDMQLCSQIAQNLPALYQGRTTSEVIEQLGKLILEVLQVNEHSN